MVILVASKEGAELELDVEVACGDMGIVLLLLLLVVVPLEDDVDKDRCCGGGGGGKGNPILEDVVDELRIDRTPTGDADEFVGNDVARGTGGGGRRNLLLVPLMVCSSVAG